MELDKETKGILKHSNSHAKVTSGTSKQVNIDVGGLPSLKLGSKTPSNNFEFMAKDLSRLGNEERLENKLAFYYQPYSKNGYEFREYMKFEANEEGKADLQNYLN